MHTRSRLNNPTKRLGGKANLARWIIGHLPHHRVYVEALAASASVLMNKPPSKLEVINDIDDIWVNTYSVISRDEIVRPNRVVGSPRTDPHTGTVWQHCPTRNVQTDEIADYLIVRRARLFDPNPYSHIP